MIAIEHSQWERERGRDWFDYLLEAKVGPHDPFLHLTTLLKTTINWLKNKNKYYKTVNTILFKQMKIVENVTRKTLFLIKKALKK